VTTDVHLRIDTDSDDDREVVMQCLRDLNTPELVEDGEGMRFVIETDVKEYALIRVQTLVRGALLGTPFADTDVVRWSATGHWT
jgi:hypothetical protein